MSVNNRGLVATKRNPAKARSVPRLLSGLLHTRLPLPPPTKAQASLIQALGGFTHLQRQQEHLRQQARLVEQTEAEKTESPPLKETT